MNQDGITDVNLIKPVCENRFPCGRCKLTGEFCQAEYTITYPYVPSTPYPAWPWQTAPIITWTADTTYSSKQEDNGV